ncbi:hypothetical protein JL720_11139 [Aureococcus anophagefferens]|nr:hypothetical protein JL720_11139 [Aureococcus anophagefferens]
MADDPGAAEARLAIVRFGVICLKHMRRVALGARLALIALGLAVDALRPLGLRYTDVDYDVLRDGAAAMVAGAAGGPYARATFRYSPLLALPLVGDVAAAGLPVGKVVFALADVALGARVEALLRARGLSANRAAALAAAGWYLNPVALNLCARQRRRGRRGARRGRPRRRGGPGAPRRGGRGRGARPRGARLYPVVHAPAFALAFLRRDGVTRALAFGGAFAAAAAAPTALAYFCYGSTYVDNAGLPPADRRARARLLGRGARGLAGRRVPLEFAGDAAHGPLWALGLGFLGANAGLLAAVLAGGVS